MRKRETTIETPLFSFNTQGRLSTLVFNGTIDAKCVAINEAHQLGLGATGTHLALRGPRFFLQQIPV
jgi:hypothetical protein